jgi:RNA polymerase sigma-70 factor (ECF subfamily)
MIYRLAHHMTGHVEDAEDLAQEALVRILQQLKTFRNDCALRTWLYRVTLNVCLSSRRKARLSTVALEESRIPDTDLSPESRLVERSVREQVQREILRLHSGYREILLLRLLEELEYSEIAEIMQISVKVAQLRFHRGMKQLRDRLIPAWEEERRG